MGESKKSKRITWAPNLCQVRLFSSAKPPSEVGLAKTCPNEPDVPPGFEPRIPCTRRWRCPAKMEVNGKWEVEVAAGEQSKEVEVQKERESRVLEAIFPRPSPIPPNPHLPVNAQESVNNDDDDNIILIPRSPIEEVHTSNATPTNICDGTVIIESARAVLASVFSNSLNADQINSIDPVLLIRILTNPKLFQQLLITTHQEPLSMKTQLNAPTTATAMAPAPPFCPPQLVSTTGPSPPVVKDINYYKSLIRLHGGPQSCTQSNQGATTQEFRRSRDDGGFLPQSCTQSMGGATQEFRKSRDATKPRIMRRCIFYNSNRGCKNGANCAYHHDVLTSQKRAALATDHVFAAKRIKFGR